MAIVAGKGWHGMREGNWQRQRACPPLSAVLFSPTDTKQDRSRDPQTRSLSSLDKLRLPETKYPGSGFIG